MSRTSTPQRINISAHKKSLAKTLAIAIATVGMAAIPVQPAQAGLNEAAKSCKVVGTSSESSPSPYIGPIRSGGGTGGGGHAR
jgi:uncharacterized membrane protein